MTATLDSALAQIDQAMRLVFVDPARARQVALDARSMARRDSDVAAESAAERVLGLAARELNDLGVAARHLRRAIAVADRAGLAVPGAEARMSMALVRAMQGDNAGALQLSNAAEQVLRDGLEAARLQMQRALIAERQGHFDEATAGFAQALTVFRREGDELWEAKLLNNRGIMRTYRGLPQAAEADLERAERLYAGLGQDLAVADTRWNRGFAAGRSGAVAKALRLLAAAEEYYERHGIAQPLLLIDKCEVLLAAGLFGEARHTVAKAVAELSRRHMAADLAEARLMFAQAAVACGDLDGARDAARHARRAFIRQGRPGWAALARYVLVRAAWSANRNDGNTLRRALASGDELSAAGWAVYALDARMIAAHVALRLNRLPLAASLLSRASEARHRGLPALRASAWHATALLRLASDDRRGAQAALRAGLRVLDQHRLTLGATELRVHAAEYGTELATTGLSLALASRRTARILAWAERGRARSLGLRPVRPPIDPQLANNIAELRAITFQRDGALAEGRDASALTRRQARLERSIRDHSRRVVGDGTGASDTTFIPSALAGCLGHRALVNLVAADGTLYAVVVAGRRSRLHTLGPTAEVIAELGALRFALRRIAVGHGSASRMADSLDYSARWLDARLLRPLDRWIADRDLVVVPTGELHGLPWSLLPSCRGRAVSVAPSATAWLRAMDAGAAPSSDLVFVAGPGLPDAAAEVQALAEGYDGATLLIGTQAKVAAVISAIDGASSVHLAAHGTFRAENPQFSALNLADGPLNVYDLEMLRRPPQLVVLSACNSGVSAVHSGDELMGFAAAVLALGTRSLIATVVPILDASAKDLMLDLHARLRAGAGPAAALAAAQDAAASGAEAAAFVCYGAG